MNDEKSKLQHGEIPIGKGADALSEKKTIIETKSMEKSKFRMEKTGKKLETAAGKKNKKKPQKNPGLIKNIGQNLTAYASMSVHGKIHEAEHENTGLESAHRTELAGERAGHHISRFIKQRNRTRPARKMRKLENRSLKAKADYQFKKLASENPGFKKNSASRFMQKQRLKKMSQKKARKTAKKNEKMIRRLIRNIARLGGFLTSNPEVLLVILVVIVFLVMILSCVGAFALMGNGLVRFIYSASYSATDADIDNVELAYTEWETDLRIQINELKSTRPGFDEYRYNIGYIGHDPFELMAYLTAVYNEFTYSDIQGDLRNLFNEHYTLSTLALTETNEDGEEIRVLEITLTVKPFTDLILSRMDADEQERYALLMYTKGGRQYVWSPFPVNWLPYVTSYYGYRLHPISGVKDYHEGVDIAFPEGTEILSGIKGTAIFSGTSAEYGLVVALDDGWGVVAKYAHCSELLVTEGQKVEAGQVIAKVGSTGTGTGPHLHFEIVRNGQYLNPLFYAYTNNNQI